MCDSRRGFGLQIGFIDNFNTRLVTTLIIALSLIFHTVQITTTHAKSFQFVRFEVSTAVTMMIIIFWEATRRLFSLLSLAVCR
jgi:hypothetical protein